ncbi:Uncharacterised protein [Streptococcus pneumoniae]|nr:Uncharacterised protein [Streptococcus pneumoniae]
MQAGSPVDSLIRFAALPVGAVNSIGNGLSSLYSFGFNDNPCSDAYISTIPLITVVFPVPGPPVNNIIGL